MPVINGTFVQIDDRTDEDKAADVIIGIVITCVAAFFYGKRLHACDGECRRGSGAAGRASAGRWLLFSYIA